MLADVAPVLQTSLEPPDAVNVADAPAQTEVDEALTLILGTTLTAIAFEMLAVQPPAFVPVTE